ncbi:hypothetical protein ACFYNO_17505 [Kitasatospora sp. NPDC006697]|uniref:hypothetical protein n=1 Tax=Kitasatospora sp. NPDC006697 TaxID=3364020 RepID=UPI003679381F
MLGEQVGPSEPMRAATEELNGSVGRWSAGGDLSGPSSGYAEVAAQTERVSDGKTRREAIRCLKRYVAREAYQLIPVARKPAPAPASAD